MTLAEAVEVIDLEPNTSYRRDEVERKCKEAQIRTQRTYYTSSVVPEQKATAKHMEKLKVAKDVLLATMKGNVLHTPARSKAVAAMPKAASKSAPASAPASPSVSRQTGSPAPGQMKQRLLPLPTSFIQVVQRLALAIGGLLYVLWLLVSWPLRLLLQRRVWKAGLATLLVACLLWFVWAFCTTGVHGLAMKIEQGSEWINRITVMAMSLREGKAVSWKHPSTTLTVNNSSSTIISIDNKICASGATFTQGVDSGSHRIEVKNGKTRYSLDLYFPTGGNVGIECHKEMSSTVLAVTIEMPDSTSHISQAHDLPAGPVALGTIMMSDADNKGGY